jgi:hypothetical protein
VIAGILQLWGVIAPDLLDLSLPREVLEGLVGLISSFRRNRIGSFPPCSTVVYHKHIFITSQRPATFGLRYKVVTGDLVTEVLRHRPDLFLSAVRPMKRLSYLTSLAVRILWLMVSQMFWR